MRTKIERWYKVGKHLPNVPDNRKFYHMRLKPMTHSQACTFIAKQQNPADWFVFEVELNGETPL